MVKIEILADSVNPWGNRVTTFRIKFPRIIEAEILRHRMLSFSAASSRAINLEKHIEKVERDPFIPTRFTKDCKGMSAKEYLSDTHNLCAKDAWECALENTLDVVKRLNRLNVHKQHASRLLQPFEYQEMIVTGTEWENFFSLRCPQYYILGLEEDTYRSQQDIQRVIKKYNTKGFDPLKHNKSTAQPEIQELAEMMLDEYRNSIPEMLLPGEWHVPLCPEFDDLHSFLVTENSNIDQDIYSKAYQEVYNKACVMVSCARIARISYLSEVNDFKKDIDLYNKLIQMKHYSPLEHVCRSMTEEEYNSFVKGKLMVDNDEYFTIEGPSMEVPCEFGYCNNFRGFIQQRYLAENQ